MHLVLLTVLSLAAYASAFVEVESLVGYHQRVGIPMATKIQDAERAILSNKNTGSRIVGGSVAHPNAHPYLGGLLINFANHPGTSVCSSSLISDDRLVTAAHCWVDGILRANRMVVVLGTSLLFTDGKRIAASDVVVHHEWNPASRQNDVAIIYLPNKVVFSDQIQPIALPTNHLEDTFAGDWSIAAGYGKTSDDQDGVPVNSVVNHVRLEVISVAQCQAVFGSRVQPSNVCTSGTGGVGICGGDSGSPLFVFRDGVRVLVGIGSFIAAGGCQQGHPSAFARVTSFHSFISEHL